MPIENPYRPLVVGHEKIFTLEDELYTKKGEWEKFFGNNNEIRLEIGTGLGNFFAYETDRLRDRNFVGMELKYKRLFKTAEKTLEKGVENFALLKDFGQNIDKIFAENEIEQTYVFFPDPWPKDRHAKHRLLQREFLEKLYFITKNGGKLVYKTDHRAYFDQVVGTIEEMNSWKVEKISYDYEKELDEFDKKNMTEFEVLFRNKGIKTNYIELVKE